MENDELSDSITTTQDSTMQQKHAAMLERLSNRHQSRSLANTSTTSSKSESTESFLSNFNQSRVSIESQISGLLSGNPITTTEQISAAISDLETFLSQNSYFLPSYELRSCLSAVSELRTSLRNTSSILNPKPKFSFKNKPKKTHPTTAPPSQNTDNAIPMFENVENEPFVKVTDQIVSRDTPNAGPGSRNNVDFMKMGSGVRNNENVGRVGPGFRGKENQVLVKECSRRSDNRGGDEENGEFTLSELRGCEVRIRGCLRALFMNKLKDCKVYIGPVWGSILIEDVEDCVFILASHQIRIHDAKSCDFYLRVRSRPIIEDSNGVRFAPYCLMYDEIERDLQEANLNEETGNWANVDDFRWLRAVQSPNWCVLPENERIGVVDISESGV